MATDKDLTKKIEMLIVAAERVYPRKRVLIWRSFLQGLFFSLGTTIGLSIVLAILTFFIRQLNYVPIISDIIEILRVENILERN